MSNKDIFWASKAYDITQDYPHPYVSRKRVRNLQEQSYIRGEVELYDVLRNIHIGMKLAHDQ
jgi:hypothetical protein